MRPRISSPPSKGRPAFGSTPSDASVTHLITELKASGLEGHALSVSDDGHSGRQRRCPIRRPASRRSRPIHGAATSPAIRRPVSPARPTAPRLRPTQVDAFFGIGDRRPAGTIAVWCCTTPTWRATAGGVDAFLIGSELRRPDARALGVRRLSGGDAARRRSRPTSRRSSATIRSSPMAPTGPSMARMWSMTWRRKCAFRSMHCGRRRDRCGRHRLLRAARRLARHRGRSRPQRSPNRSTIRPISPAT